MYGMWPGYPPRASKEGDRLYTENFGAYSTALTTRLNGFDGARIIHIHNRQRCYSEASHYQ